MATERRIDGYQYRSVGVDLEERSGEAGREDTGWMGSLAALNAYRSMLDVDPPFDEVRMERRPVTYGPAEPAEVVRNGNALSLPDPAGVEGDHALDRAFDTVRWRVVDTSFPGSESIAGGSDGAGSPVTSGQAGTRYPAPAPNTTFGAEDER